MDRSRENWTPAQNGRLDGVADFALFFFRVPSKIEKPVNNLMCHAQNAVSQKVLLFVVDLI